MTQSKSESKGGLPVEVDRQFEIAVRRLADDLRFGYDSSPFVGSGVDYVQSRPFVDGDSVKNIDWKLTAKHNRFHVKEFESLKCTPIYLLVDTSASMCISSQAFSKFALAVLLAGGLGLAAVRRLSPVGLMAVGSRRLHVQPSLSRAKMFQWLYQLRHLQYDETTVVSSRLNQLQQQLRSQALIVLISDLHEHAAVKSLKQASIRHDCVVIQLQDPAERGRLRAGILRTMEAESGRQKVTSGKTRFESEEDSQSIAKELKRAAIDHLVLCTDQPFAAPVRRFLAERGGLLRNAR